MACVKINKFVDGLTYSVYFDACQIINETVPCKLKRKQKINFLVVWIESLTFLLFIDSCCLFKLQFFWFCLKKCFAKWKYLCFKDICICLTSRFQLSWTHSLDIIRSLPFKEEEKLYFCCFFWVISRINKMGMCGVRTWRYFFPYVSSLTK